MWPAATRRREGIPEQARERRNPQHTRTRDAQEGPAEACRTRQAPVVIVRDTEPDKRAEPAKKTCGADGPRFSRTTRVADAGTSPRRSRNRGGYPLPG